MEDIEVLIEKWESHGLLDDSKNKKNLALGFEVLYDLILSKKIEDKNTYMFPIYRRVVEKYDGDLDLLTITYVVNYLIGDFEKWLESDQAKELYSNIWMYGIDVEAEMSAMYCDGVDINKIIKKND
jgi:hypothetical protein